MSFTTMRVMAFAAPSRAFAVAAPKAMRPVALQSSFMGNTSITAGLCSSFAGACRVVDGPAACGMPSAWGARECLALQLICTAPPNLAALDATMMTHRHVPLHRPPQRPGTAAVPRGAGQRQKVYGLHTGGHPPEKDPRVRVPGAHGNPCWSPRARCPPAQGPQEAVPRSKVPQVISACVCNRMTQTVPTTQILLPF